jgi:hypothetical protein
MQFFGAFRGKGGGAGCWWPVVMKMQKPQSGFATLRRCEIPEGILLDSQGLTCCLKICSMMSAYRKTREVKSGNLVRDTAHHSWLVREPQSQLDGGLPLARYRYAHVLVHDRMSPDLFPEPSL